MTLGNQLIKSAGSADRPCEAEIAYEKGLEFRYSKPYSGTAAFSNFKIASDLGHELACLELAKMYSLGLSVPISESQAFHYYQKAADLGNRVAIDEMAWRLLFGHGIKRDLQKGLDSLQKNSYQFDANLPVFQVVKLLADAGNAQFQFALAKVYEGGFGYEISLENALKYYELAAHNGKATWGVLGKCYKQGRGTKKDRQKARECAEKGYKASDPLAIHLISELNSGDEKIRFLQEAVDLGLGLAEFELGRRYLKKGKYVEGFYLMHCASDHEIAQSYLFTAKCYFEGFGTLASSEIAFKYFKKSADSGNRRGQFYTAYCYGEGLGTEKNLDLAKTYYQINPFSINDELRMWTFSKRRQSKLDLSFLCLKRSADNGNLLAQWRLTQIYDSGADTIVEKSLEDAFYYWQLLAEAGNANAQLEVGVRLVEGLGCRPEERMALHYYELALKQGCKAILPHLKNFLKITKNQQIHDRVSFLYNFYCDQFGERDTKFALAFCYLKGTGTEKSQEQGLEILHSAAQNKDDNALCLLGRYYLSGEGVLQNEEKAVGYLQQAAELNNSSAQATLGRCFENGTGVAKNLETAFHLYQSSADGGCALGQMYLGLYHEKGLGGSISREKAFYNFHLASSQQMAYVLLGKCYENGWGTEKNEKLALKYYFLSSEQNNSLGFYYLGRCYEFGLGVELNKKLAFDYYHVAAEKGNLMAVDKLVEFYENGIGVQQSTELATQHRNLYSYLLEQNEEVDFPLTG